MSIFSLKSMRGRSINNTIKKLFREEIVEWILPHPNVKPLCVSSNVVTVLNPVSNLKGFL